MFEGFLRYVALQLPVVVSSFTLGKKLTLRHVAETVFQLKLSSEDKLASMKS